MKSGEKREIDTWLQKYHEYQNLENPDQTVTPRKTLVDDSSYQSNNLEKFLMLGIS